MDIPAGSEAEWSAGQAHGPGDEPRPFQNDGLGTAAGDGAKGRRDP